MADEGEEALFDILGVQITGDATDLLEAIEQARQAVLAAREKLKIEPDKGTTAAWETSAKAIASSIVRLGETLREQGAGIDRVFAALRQSLKLTQGEASQVFNALKDAGRAATEAGKTAGEGFKVLPLERYEQALERQAIRLRELKQLQAELIAIIGKGQGGEIAPWLTKGPAFQQVSQLFPGTQATVEGLEQAERKLQGIVNFIERWQMGLQQLGDLARTLTAEEVEQRANIALTTEAVHARQEAYKALERAATEAGRKGEWREANKLRGQAEAVKQEIAELTDAWMRLHAEMARQVQASFGGETPFTVAPSLVGSRDPNEYFLAALRQQLGIQGIDVNAAFRVMGMEMDVSSAAADWGNAMHTLAQSSLSTMAGVVEENVTGKIGQTFMAGKADLVLKDAVVDFKAIDADLANTLRQYASGAISFNQLLDEQAKKYILQLESYRQLLGKPMAQLALLPGKGAGFASTAEAWAAAQKEIQFAPGQGSLVGANVLNLPELPKGITPAFGVLEENVAISRQMLTQQATSERMLTLLSKMSLISQQELEAARQQIIAEKELERSQQEQLEAATNKAIQEGKATVAAREAAAERQRLIATAGTPEAQAPFLGPEVSTGTLEDRERRLGVLQQELRLKKALLEEEDKLYRAQQRAVSQVGEEKKKAGLIDDDQSRAAAKRAADIQIQRELAALSIRQRSRAEVQREVGLLEQAVAKQKGLVLATQKEAELRAQQITQPIQDEVTHLGQAIQQTKAHTREREQAINKARDYVTQLKQMTQAEREAAIQAAAPAARLENQAAINARIAAEKELASSIARSAKASNEEAAALANVIRQQQGAVTTAREYEATTEAVLRAKQQEAAIHNSVATSYTNAGNKLKGYIGSATREAGNALDWLAMKTRNVFVGSFLAQFAYGIIGGIQQAFRTAIDYTKRLETEFARLRVQVAATQQVLGASAGSIEQWEDAIKRLQKRFGIFTSAELAQASYSIQQIGREYGLTFEQMIEIMEAASILAITNSKDVSEMAQLIARAVREDLRGLNEYIGKVNDADIANEMLRMGLRGKFEDLSDAEQMQVRYNLIMERATRSEEKLAEILSTTENRQKASTNTLLDASVVLGGLNTLWSAFLGLLSDLAPVLGAVKYVLDSVVAMLLIGTSVFPAFTKTLISFTTGLREGQSVLEALQKVFKNFKDSWQEIVASLVPKEALLSAAKSFIGYGSILVEVYAAIAEAALYASYVVIMGSKEAARVAKEDADNLRRSYYEATADVLKNLEDLYDATIRERTTAPPDVKTPEGYPDPNELRDLFDTLTEDYDKYSDDVDKANKRLRKRLDEEEATWQDDRREMWWEGFMRLLEMEEELEERRIEIKEDAVERLKDAEEKYNDSVAKAKRDAAEREEDALAKMAEEEAEDALDRQEEEEDNLKKHLERMRDIQEKYYYQLLDAIQERDARKVLTTIRDRNLALRDEEERYAEDLTKEAENIEKKRLKRERDYAKEKARRERDLQERLDDLAENLEEQRIEIAKDRDKRLADEEEEYDKRVAKQKDQNKEQLDDFDALHRKRMDQIRDENTEELRELKDGLDGQVIEHTNAWVDKYKVDAIYWDAVAALMNSYIGPGGIMTAMWTAFNEMIGRGIPIPELEVPVLPPTAPPYGITPTIGRPLRYAEGGSFITNGPTTAMFGEGASPHELVMAVPLPAGGALPTAFGSLPAQRLEIRVTADENFSQQFEDAVILKIAEVVQDITPVRGQRSL